jgi:hypothetical protein
MASCNSGNKKMNNVVQTKFAGRNPFKPKHRAIDVKTIRITNDKPKKRICKTYKYDFLFKELDIGKALSCLPEDCDKVAQALRSYVLRYNKPWKIKGQLRYTQTTSRIFVLEMK